jgi:hypothetical protein
MPIDHVSPELAVSLSLDPYAPRAARYYVGQVDRPSPDLRDAVVLLTSELVTRAVQQCGSASTATVELRAWMPSDVVRVELRATRELLPAPDTDELDYGLLLLNRMADRWSIDCAADLACMWFEIDRHSIAAADLRPPGERAHTGAVAHRAGWACARAASR